MKLLVALYHPFSLWTAPPWLAERLRHDFPSLSVSQLPGPRYEGLEEEIADADICIAWSIRPEQFRCARQLKWVHSPAAAVHQLMFPEMVASDVVLTNARSVHGPVVAEHALALAMALAKKLHTSARLQQQLRWGQQIILEQTPTIVELSGAEVLLIGLGSIGQDFARRARSLGMKVTAVREHGTEGSDFADEVVRKEHLDDFLPRADFIVLAAPLTPSTHHLINAARIKRMKRTAYLVNVSRGPLIDDEALVEALREDRIAGAALDVFAEEPLSRNSPYWDLPNVIVTPHTAAVTPKLWERHYELISANLRRFLAGQPLLNVVNKHLGY